jgi:hypothetical protein
VASGNENIVSLDQDGTAKYGQHYVAYSGDLRQQRMAWLTSVEQQVQQLGPWADEFKTQMGTVNGSGTLNAAFAAGHRVANGWEDHGNTAIKHSQVMPQVDGDHGTKLNGIET